MGKGGKGSVVMAAMRVLLKDRMTGLFYAGPGSWTERAATGCVFERVDQAIGIAVSQRLADAEVVYYFGNPRLDVSFPVRIRDRLET